MRRIQKLEQAKNLEKDSETFTSFFSKVLFIYFFKFLNIILCNDEINMLWKRSKYKMVDKRGRDKNQICKWWNNDRK
jgi:hypothetical protein